MVHLSTNEYRLCDLFSLTNTGKTSINSLYNKKENTFRSIGGQL